MTDAEKNLNSRIASVSVPVEPYFPKLLILTEPHATDKNAMLKVTYVRREEYLNKRRYRTFYVRVTEKQL